MGAWNVAILNPKWIANEIMKLPIETAILMELGVGTTLRLRAKIADLFFIPTNERLILNPSKEDDEVFKLADSAVNKLYNTLPYTPIEAIGYNFTYELDEREDFSVDIKFELPCLNDFYKDIEASAVLESEVHHALKLSNDAYVIFNITLRIVSDKKIVAINYHYQTDNDRGRIEHALDKFYINYKHSQLAISRLTKNGE
ncbi:hypothetical protein MBAV_000962 [Candidatus Magnetobacterium bavaricum]|uniref:Uncharacterized protein n=1 Tax=Candidatus Magnetobacterium bavaricum TaxID=29290 RepID=A0A0F3H1R0_9BACT|nr:hypothetical protein MBAV_000962 [Candidatus Magnetobacterium bavaricum]